MLPKQPRPLEGEEIRRLMKIDRRPITEEERAEAKRVHNVYLSMKARMK